MLVLAVFNILSATYSIQINLNLGYNISHEELFNISDSIILRKYVADESSAL